MTLREIKKRVLCLALLRWEVLFFFLLILFAFFSCFYLFLKCLLLYHVPRGGKTEEGKKLEEGNLENEMCVLYVCFAYDFL